ncbi:coiled-coil domain-containing protein AGAP005037 isoform X3 [Zerene cesonia]|uniref:coiled-coil domain-containing protein AGAP005037 isoform X3 n=1 Tax=Zerene cesonia TaxID=33412 RepID=UPI0018E50D56|nr:coiled-coil domain-containing protein AGAP005037 isoform X3 [Zerene cesonia]
MSESSRKKTSSFRKIFPFFSHKSKDKLKDVQPISKMRENNSKTINQYYNPQTMISTANEKRNISGQDDQNDRIYENLSIRTTLSRNNNQREVESKDSSNSTLVSESVIISKHNHNADLPTQETDMKIYVARPQVPPKPHNENFAFHPGSNNTQREITQYPDVYYHSVERLVERISPVDEIEIYKAAQTNPASVGAEIKRVSTTFLISPKKEAEVRTLQPIRARSLSLDKHKPCENPYTKTNYTVNKYDNKKKAYHYSAPTSPIAVNHRLPNMPLTVSPYEHVRKIIFEGEEGRNSMSRSSTREQSTPPTSPFRDVAKSPTPSAVDKGKTRQKVEAFYWKKIKEMKEKEDEYIMRQTMNTTTPLQKCNAPNSISNCSSPNSFVLDPRINSYPIYTKEANLRKQTDYYTASPFTRGAPERRTDSFISNKTYYPESDIIYRHPQKLSSPVIFGQHTPLYQRGSLNRENRAVVNQYPKRVSFDNNHLKHDDSASVTSNNSKLHNERRTNSRLSDFKPMPSDVIIKNGVGPPQPPIRTTSVSSGSASLHHKLVNNRFGRVSGGHSIYSESESGSEAGEIQRILLNDERKEEDWQGDGRIDGGLSDGEATRVPFRSRSSRRDDPRRHTLAGNNLYLHPHHAADLNNLDLEQYRPAQAANVPVYATVIKDYDMRRNRSLDPRFRKPPLPRGYLPQTFFYDDDPGVMSEVETSSTGFRRGGKQRSSLPVVRTPSKTLERPLGLVFLQYRNETKRALLPNEITSLDTVKALFVRSFPKQLTMDYLDSPLVKVYIHDSSKDMFYELEDVRAHLRDIRDRSVLRLFESKDLNGGVFPGALGVGSVRLPALAATSSSAANLEEQSTYFSEPEIDSDHLSQHVHKSKSKPPAYYMGPPAPSTLPRGGSVLRAFSPAAPPVPADRVKTIPPPGAPPVKPVRSYVPGTGSERCFPFSAGDCPRGTDQLYTIPAHSSEGYMSSPERGSARVPYEDPYYTQFLGPAAARPAINPVIDEETSDAVIIDDAYQMYGVNAITTAPRPMPRPPYDARLGPPVDDMQRLRVEKMERQLANLTGLVQKALQVPGGPAPPTVAPRQDFQQPSTSRVTTQDAARFASSERPPKLGRDRFQKSVSFEKSVSFSDDPPDMNSPKQHSPQHSADTKPTKPAIKSSTLPRTSSQERDRLKPAPPPKPAGLVGQPLALVPQKTYTVTVTPDFFNQLHLLQKQSHDLRIETRNLRRTTLSHAMQMRQMMADTIVKIGTLAARFCEEDPESQLTREEEIYRQDMLLLENDLYELEATVERLRGQAANRLETRVNMADIERIAMVLSKSSKTVADWKLKFPVLQETMKVKLAAEMEKVVRKEKMLEEEPERLELALRRCKKLTGTLVTLKRLACVQEQRLPLNDGRVSPSSSQSSTATAGPSSEEYHSENACHVNQSNKAAGAGRVCTSRGTTDVRPENALDALLDELQTFAKPAERSARGEGPLRRLHSYPSGSDTDASPPVRARGQHPPKPPVPERHPELLAIAARRAPPPPPPRTTSRSPLASPTSPSSPPCNEPADPNDAKAASRQALLEQRHQELLKKQKALQEQYARLQMIQRSGPTLPMNAQPDLKKTGSESNLLTKMNLNLAPASISGSMTHLAGDTERKRGDISSEMPTAQIKTCDAVATTNKVYETDIL